MNKHQQYSTREREEMEEVMKSGNQASRGDRPGTTVLAAMAVFALLAGCAEPYRVDITDTVLLCSSAPKPPSGPVTLEILFEQNADGVWCPTAPRDPCPAAFTGRTVSWKSMQKVGDRWEPLETRYRIYFSPINAHTILKSGSNGVVEPKLIDQSSPRGVYKYTVWDDPIGNDDHQCDPLDPNFFVY